MSVTRGQNIMRIRDLLDSPLPQRPSLHRMLAQEISEEMDVVNATNNSGIPWATQTYQLNYTPGTDTYTINVSDWGKVLYVVRLTGNQYIQAINVPFDDLSNQSYGYIWTNWWGQYGTLPFINNTPEKMSFYRESVINSGIMVKINPMPAESWTYELTYIPGYIGVDDPLTAAIQLPEHAELVRLRAAMALLPYTEWGDDMVMNDAKRKTLAATFAYQLDRKEPIFNKYIKSINIPKMVDVSDWNS